VGAEGHDFFVHSGQHTSPFALNVQPLASALATKSEISFSVVSFAMTWPQSAQHIDATARVTLSIEGRPAFAQGRRRRFV